jgi:hypothetical protein
VRGFWLIKYRQKSVCCQEEPLILVGRVAVRTRGWRVVGGCKGCAWDRKGQRGSQF